MSKLERIKTVADQWLGGFDPAEMIREIRAILDEPDPVPPPRPHVFLALPTDGRIMPQVIDGLKQMGMRAMVSPVPNQFGDVQHNFNTLWCAAMNARRDAGLTHFAMLHSDVQVVTPNWIDVLIEEMDRVDADLLSVVMAIKDNHGLTTTGIRYPGVWGTRRLVMREIMQLPETFSIKDTCEPDMTLAWSAGCWICRLPQEGWPDRFPGFYCKYKVARNDGGYFEPWFDSEEWLASDWFAAQGLKVYATRKIHINHIGGALYPNNQAWGEWETDKHAPAKPIAKPAGNYEGATERLATMADTFSLGIHPKVDIEESAVA